MILPTAIDAHNLPSTVRTAIVCSLYARLLHCGSGPNDSVVVHRIQYLEFFVFLPSVTLSPVLPTITFNNRRSRTLSVSASSSFLRSCFGEFPLRSDHLVLSCPSFDDNIRFID
ncbi:hypothetical protein VTN77DRAFT_7539 [Rasamsonia byssochlamydoides]|uniref:uncharacterized protein n=1 Tax=Rasamsonia byssochlamydoides TaxID=89139 RepID=UPI00374326D6